MKTLEEIVAIEQLKYGEEVIVEIPGEYKFEGKIVGLGIMTVMPFYLVECTDDFIPNETYQYKVTEMPLSYIRKKIYL